MDSMDADRPGRGFQPRSGLEPSSQSNDSVSGSGAAPGLIPPNLHPHKIETSIYQRVVASVADIKHLMEGISLQVDEIQLSDEQFTGDGEIDKQLMLLRVERLLAKLNILTTAVANYGKQLAGSPSDPSLRRSRQYQPDLIPPKLEEAPQLGAALAVSDLRASLKNYKEVLKRPGFDNAQLTPLINDLVSRNASLWYQVGGLEFALEELIRAETRIVTVDDVQDAIRERVLNDKHKIGLLSRCWLKFQRVILTGMNLFAGALSVVDKIGDLTVRGCIGVMEGAMHCITPCVRDVMGPPPETLLASERVLREQRSTEDKRAKSRREKKARQSLAFNPHSSREPGEVVTEFSLQAQSQKLGKSAVLARNEDSSKKPVPINTTVSGHKPVKQQSPPPPVPKRHHKTERNPPPLRGEEAEMLSSALKTRLGPWTRQKARTQAKESFVRHFQSRVPPESFTPWLGTDVDRYVDQIRSSVKQEADRTQSDLSEARRRSVSSQGLHSEQEKEVVQLEERHSLLVDEGKNERVKERLSFYSPQPLSLEAMTVQIAAINSSLKSIANSQSVSETLEDLESSIEERVDTLRQMKARLYELKGDRVAFDEPILDQIGDGFEAARKARLRVRTLYAYRVTDPETCKQGVQNELERLHQDLSKEHKESPRLIDIQKVLHWLHTNESHETFWTRLNALLNLESSNLKEILFRYYSTVVQHARVEGLERSLRLRRHLTNHRACSFEQWSEIVQKYLSDSEGNRQWIIDAGLDEDRLSKGDTEWLNKLALRVHSIGERLAQNCAAGLEPEWTDRPIVHLAMGLLNRCQVGEANQALLLECSSELRMPVIKLAAKDSALFPPESFDPFLSDIQLTELSFRSLEKLACKILGKPSLDENEIIELSRVYHKILDELRKRDQGEFFILDGLLEDD
ncbi:hypothetical protein [Endozoicomonas arenosclerae]|uniref:hypothetical protein n=1 Tax=Endozoicomonas arenosclerae TaxID=1633495 RepID=UPI000781F0EF|nr:hypothetical protein [Endozoicomonas arenosclerae]